MKLIKLLLSVWVSVGIFILLFLLSALCKADDTIDLKQVSVEYHKFNDFGRDPMITENPYTPGRELGTEINLTINTDVLNYFYWNNRILSKTDRDVLTHSDGQFRYVAWEWYLGVRLNKYINLEYKHLSQHVLDTQYPHAYPVQDSIGVNVIIYSKNKERSLF